ncbi:MAG: 3-hydroxybutyrate dehydrogenase, partial [Candidatus Obscuribacterales bacterium]|nr:3-hydroxybutyrate dehydrogenase [Candidatus Obscuribacterales bacterium]
GLESAPQAESITKELEGQSGQKIRYHGADMSKPDQIGELIDATVAELGAPDILVNNAGIQHTASIENFPAEKWDAIIAINLSSSFHTMRKVVPLMKTSGWGRIINIASTHGLVASINKAAYVAAKHGVIGLTKVVALETAETGITVNAVCPGWVLTPLVQKQIDDLAAAEKLSAEEASARLLAAKQPSKRFTSVDQLGDLVVFLCSDSASNMTGIAIPVDGGWTAQ